MQEEPKEAPLENGEESNVEQNASVSTEENDFSDVKDMTEETSEELEESTGEEMSKEVSQSGMAKHQIQHYSPVLHQPTGNTYAQVIEAANALGSIGMLADEILKSKLCPLKTVADITLAIITGQQYGFHFMTSVACIFPINGKPTMSIHLHRALVLSKGIHINKDYDFEPIYSWGKVGEDGKWITKDKVVDDKGTIKAVPVVYGLATEDKKPEGLIKIKEVDRITQYTFTRMQRQLDGSFKDLKVVSKFTMSQAAKADLLDKDNWVKYPHSMCEARAFGIGSKEIAADTLYGIYSVSELADAANIPYTISDTLEERVSN